MGASGFFKFMILGLKQCKPLTFASGLCQEEPEVLGAQTCPTSGGKPGKVRNGSSVFQWLRIFQASACSKARRARDSNAKGPCELLLILLELKCDMAGPCLY